MARSVADAPCTVAPMLYLHHIRDKSKALVPFRVLVQGLSKEACNLRRLYIAPPIGMAMGGHMVLLLVEQDGSWPLTGA